jgi:hypothetical protein
LEDLGDVGVDAVEVAKFETSLSVEREVEDCESRVPKALLDVLCGLCAEVGLQAREGVDEGAGWGAKGIAEELDIFLLADCFREATSMIPCQARRLLDRPREFPLQCAAESRVVEAVLDGLGADVCGSRCGEVDQLGEVERQGGHRGSLRLCGCR